MRSRLSFGTSGVQQATWEVRSTIGNRIARVLFAVEQGEKVLLHAFIKKTQQTDIADIELALKRIKDWKMATQNQHRGSSFDDFLKEDDIFEVVQAKALKREQGQTLLPISQYASLNHPLQRLRQKSS